jgi:hypothetical protein
MIFCAPSKPGCSRTYLIDKHLMFIYKVNLKNQLLNGNSWMVADSGLIMEGVRT